MSSLILNNIYLETKYCFEILHVIQEDLIAQYSKYSTVLLLVECHAVYIQTLVYYKIYIQPIFIITGKFL